MARHESVGRLNYLHDRIIGLLNPGELGEWRSRPANADRTSGFHETAYADLGAAAEGKPTKSITGPLFYWVASLQGDRRTVLGCFFIGSSYTGGGFGRCKSQAGEEYNIDF